MTGTRIRPLMVLLASALGLIALLAVPSGAAVKDRNNDRIPDRWEKRHHLSLKVKQTRRDQDRDGLRNRGEFLAETKPHDKDTDDDGIEDGDENAGLIQSFNSDTGRLVIALFAGDFVSGLVTSDTEIECEGRDEPKGENHDGKHEDEDGDDRRLRDSENSGPGSENEGDGDRDENDEHGERDCSTADLTPDTVVREAELEVSSAGVVFEEVELIK